MRTILAPWHLGTLAPFTIHLGTSSAGFFVKNPPGISLNPTCVTGITGHSSGRGMCVTPNVYQTTTSWFDSDSLFDTHFANPAPPGL